MDNTKVIYDVDFQGRITADGALTEFWEADALNAALKLWIASSAGDIVRFPDRGDYLSQFLLKPMSEIDVSLLTKAIQDGIEQDFEPNLRIEALTVTPDYENRTWKFYMEVYAPSLKLRTIVDEQIKAVS